MLRIISLHLYSPIYLLQIETIGDAYCVAGGLHKKVDSHAKPIAHMALKMMELSEEVLTPDGKPIKVNFQSSFVMHMFIVATHGLEGNICTFQNATSMEYDVDVYTDDLIWTLLRISEWHLLPGG